MDNTTDNEPKNPNSIEYITKDGERWDTIAQKAYGRPDMFPDLIAANQDMPIQDRLPGGLILRVPVVDEVEVKTDKELLPPWKQP